MSSVHLGESHYADSLLVAPYHVWGLASRIDRVPEWASTAVQCCIVENGAHPCAVGCVRRSLFHFGPYQGTVLREVLSEVSQTGPHEYCLTLQLLHTDADSRSPVVHQSLIQSACTTWRLHAVATDPNRSFLSISTKFAIATSGTPEHRDADAAAVHEISSFFDWWTKVQHEQLSDYVISVAYPVREGKLTVERRQQYDMFETAVVAMAVRSDVDVTIRNALDSLLQSWVRETRNSDNKDLLVTHLRQEIASARRIAEAASLASAQHTAPSSASAAPLIEPVPREDTVKEAADARGTSQTPEAQVIPKIPILSDLPKPPVTDAAHAPYAPPPVRFDPIALSKAVEKGLLNEVVARRAFDQLDRQQKGFITSEELATVLATVEHFGAFEDKDGTFHRVSESREVAKQDLKSLSAERSVPTETLALTPREKELRRKEQREADLLRAMKRHAEQWISKYARKKRGQLSFDEFCLLLLQLSLA